MLTAEPRIASLIYVAHPARAERHEDLIRSKHCARRERHDVVGARNQKMCIIAALCAEDAPVSPSSKVWPPGSRQPAEGLTASQLPSPSLISNHGFGWVHRVV